MKIIIFDEQYNIERTETVVSIFYENNELKIEYYNGLIETIKNCERFGVQ